MALQLAEQRLADAEKMARRAVQLDREPRPPSGGMQTGDMLVVGMRDWFGLLRLARFLAREAEQENED